MRTINIFIAILFMYNTLIATNVPSSDSTPKFTPTTSKPSVVGTPIRTNKTITILDDNSSPTTPPTNVLSELSDNPFIDYKAEYEKLVGKNKELTTEIEGMTIQLTKLETEHKNSISALQKKINKLESDLTASQDEVRRNFQSLLSANNTKASLSNDIEQLTHTIAELTQQVSNPGLPFDGWIYSPEMGWCFVSPTAMPYIYVNDRGWAYYEAGSTPRKFFFYDKEQWELHE